MSDQEPEGPQENLPEGLQEGRTGGSRVGRDVKAERGGKVAGRDITEITEIIKGMTPEDVDKFLEVVFKYFPQIGLKPEQLDSKLGEIRELHERLHEAKELHNNIDSLLVAFAPFSAQVELANVAYKSINLDVLDNLWREVNKRVDILLHFAEGVQYIAEKYRVVEEGEKTKKTGAKWAIEIGAKRDAINDHFRPETQNGPAILRSYRSVLRIFSSSERGGPIWWRELLELTRGFHDTSSQHMTQADKDLFATA